MEEIRNSGYIEKYPSQIGIVFIIGILYKIFRTTDYRLIQYINIFSNIVTFIFMYLVLKKINKKYKINKSAYWIMSLSFIPLILLTTYVYGDYIGLSLSVAGMYFLIDYKEKKKLYKFILSAVFMCLSYITKMNYLIVILAELIYLVMYLLQDLQEKNVKKIIQSIVGIILFAIITLMPYASIKNYCIKKYEYNKEQSLPTSVWLYIGMSESTRANGWYGQVASEAWEDTPMSYVTYPQKIKARIVELIKHPKYALNFYLKKTISGWADPYFQSIWYNVGVEDKDIIMNNIMGSKKFKLGEIYQKALTILIYGCALVVITKNRKNLNNELILLFTIFIGGVLFHTIWEMKSRYTLPYIIMLIPIASIGIEEIINEIKNSRKKKLNKGRE